MPSERRKERQSKHISYTRLANLDHTHSLYIVGREGTESGLGDLVVTDTLKSRLVRSSSKNIEDKESDTNTVES